MSALAAASTTAVTAALAAAAAADAPLRLAAFKVFTLVPFVVPLLWLGAFECVPLTILPPFLSGSAAAAAAAAVGTTVEAAAGDDADDGVDEDEFFATLAVVNIVFVFRFDWMQRTAHTH